MVEEHSEPIGFPINLDRGITRILMLILITIDGGDGPSREVFHGDVILPVVGDALSKASVHVPW